MAVPIVTEKFCIQCGLTKPVEAFNKHSSRPDGLQCYCRECCAVNAPRKTALPILAPDLPGEEWRPVVEYEGLYSVSNMGRVRSDRNYHNHSFAGQVLSASPDRDGYFTVTLSKKSRSSLKRIHRLVAQTFIGPRPEGHDINHMDGVKSNNRLENLEYCTEQENTAHAHRMGLYPDGERHQWAKLRAEQVQDIRARYAAGGTTYKKLAKEFHMHSDSIQKIVTRKIWKLVE